MEPLNQKGNTYYQRPYKWSLILQTETQMTQRWAPFKENSAPHPHFEFIVDIVKNRKLVKMAAYT